MSAIRRDFQRKHFKNPYFNPKRSKLQRKKRINLVLMALAFLLFIALIFLSRLDFFKINQIKVSGNESVSQDEIIRIVQDQIAKSRFLVFPQSNIIFFSKSQLRRTINGQYYFNELKISKKYWDTIEIAVQEKPVYLVLVTDLDKYFLDNNGTVVKKFDPNGANSQAESNGVQIIRPASALIQLPQVIDKSNRPWEAGNQALNKEYVDFILKIDQQLKDQAGLAIREYYLENPDISDLTAKTEQGWEIRFNMEDPAANQIRLLTLTLSEKIKDRSQLKYIDLRYNEKIYYQ